MLSLLKHRSLRFAFIVMAANLTIACVASAQFSSGGTGSTSGSDTGGSSFGSGTTSSGTSGTGTSSGTGSSMSSSSGDFGGVERGASIGSTNVQGFGAAAESTGGSGLGGATGGRAGGAGGLGGLGGLFGALGNAFGAQSGSATKPTIRVRLRSAVEVAPMSSDRVQAAATSVFNRVPVTSGVRNVNVTMDGRTAILTGTVGSEKDRRMSELLIRLEPGVSQIDNRVSVVE